MVAKGFLLTDFHKGIEKAVFSPKWKKLFSHGDLVALHKGLLKAIESVWTRNAGPSQGVGVKRFLIRNPGSQCWAACMLGILSCVFAKQPGGAFKVQAQTPVGAEMLQLFRASGSTAGITKLLPRELQGASQHSPLDLLSAAPIQAAVNVDALVNVEYAAVYTCLACRHARPSYSAVHVESIPIPAPSGNAATRTLNPDVQLGLSDETLEVMCPSCGKSSRTRATFQLAGLPPLLCFEVNRRSSKSDAKRNFLLRAPAEFTSVFQNVECKFRLLATVCHIGKSCSSGHFVWCTKGSDGWLQLDPGSYARNPSMSTIAERDVLSSADVSHLFYERTSVTRLHSPFPSTVSSCSSNTVPDDHNDFQSPAKQFLKDCGNTPLPNDPQYSHFRERHVVQCT